METWLKIRTKSSEEMEDCFNFDEVLNIRYFERIGKNTYKVLIRTADCDLECKGITTLQRVKERVVKGSKKYPIKSRVTFTDGTNRIIYSSNDYWVNDNAEEIARIKGKEILKIERL